MEVYDVRRKILEKRVEAEDVGFKAVNVPLAEFYCQVGFLWSTAL